MDTKTIKQQVEFKASAKDVYEALMDSKIHSQFTGAKAQIENKVGGEFTAWDGYASGKNIELITGKKIVQSWRADDWVKGAESKLTIELSEQDGQTRLNFIQTGVPEEFVKDIASGWQEYYWKPLKNYFEK